MDENFIQKVSFLLRNAFIIRLMCWPIVNTKRWIQKQTFCKTEDAAYIRQKKNLHQGKRCFVIGNGPSLKPEDLKCLEKEITFASNRIYHMFSKVDWRPTYFFSTDNDVLLKEIENFKKLPLKEKFINLSAQKYGRKVADNIHYIFLYGPFYLNRNNVYLHSISENVDKYFSQANTVTCTCIEMAIYMGFTEIYLLGVDHNYSKMVSADGKVRENKNIQTYFEGMKGGTTVSIYNQAAATQGFEVCKKYAEEHGIKILNATRGGKLEVFERVDFDKIEGLKGENHEGCMFYSD